MRTTLVVLIILAAIGIQSAHAGGPRMDWDERYEDIPGATDCWVDGFDGGQNNPFDHDRNKESEDKGNQYYRAFIVGCKEVGNTQEVCEAFTSD